jgi:DsbC/DsbD-like thiol-disulfide interchange protein
VPALVQAAPAREAPGEIVKAELLADTAGIRAGRSFTLGVLLRMQPEWHVYWRNPGDAGLATSVRWSLPEGFRAGELRWPVPEAWNQPGNIVGYGYEGSVLLAAEVQAPAGLAAGSSVPVGAEVRWLSCKHVCIPGQASLKLDLPVVEAPAPASRELFAEWAGRVPVPLGGPDSPFTAKSTGNLTEAEASANFMLLLQWKAPPSEVTWFPAPEPALKIESMSLKTESLNTQITFVGSVLAGQRLLAETLETLIVYTDPGGERRGVIVPVRLREPAAGG